MADIINTPAQSEAGGTGLLIGGILLVVLAMFFLFYGLPAMRGSADNAVSEPQAQQVPSTEVVERSTIEIPEEINVNVNESQE